LIFFIVPARGSGPHDARRHLQLVHRGLRHRARKANQPVVDLLSHVAARKNATPAQIALAWLLAQKPWIVPIPGTRKLERLDENLGAVAIELTSDDLREIATASAKIRVQGARGTGKEQYV
jgi:aryl-alcohol dehydrogenase-like predicted oxidoreductase